MVFSLLYLPPLTKPCVCLTVILTPHSIQHFTALGKQGRGPQCEMDVQSQSFPIRLLPHFLAFLHGGHEADEGKWQWSGLLSQSIKPQAGEIASAPQAFQITTLSHLNATAISKETGCIFHHRRGARSGAKETGASCLALFLERGCEVLSGNSFTAVGQSFH